MGARQGTLNNGQAAAVLVDNWNDVTDYSLAKPVNAENIVLFSRTPIADPCSLVGKNIITLANEQARKDDAALFTIGAGPCPECTVTTLYWWNNRTWQNSAASAERNNIKNTLASYAGSHNLNYVYHLVGDSQLNITSVGRSFQRDGAQLKETTIKCNGQTQLQETNNSNVFWWILIILAIILVIWLIFFRK